MNFSKTSLIALSCLSLFACGTSNPLLKAKDAQFIPTMDFRQSRFFGTNCEKIFFSTEEPTQQKGFNHCMKRVQEAAAFHGISDAIELAHIQDPKVKERYFKIGLR